LPRVGDVGRLVRRLDSAGCERGVPLLVVRVRDIERIAWREGRSAARALERRSLRSFVETAARTLRSSDALAHDDESEDFLAALLTPMRDNGSLATAADCRATLARLASAMEASGGASVETGWTILESAPGSGDRRLSAAVAQALERGGRERERFDFFSTIGHELRTPLTSIRGYLETVLEEELDAATSRRFLEVARAEAARLGRLVDGMFEASMLDLGAAAAVPREEADLVAALSTALHAVAPAAAKRGVTIEAPACTSLHVAVGADCLTQIFINVFENAIKHGREGGRTCVSIVAGGVRYAEVRVDDDGPGVVPSEREAIFALARRGSNARARGSGIGLALVRLMLDRVGGEIEVCRSHLGGAQFRVRVPLAAASAGVG
jgi:signal transduction histidine kinase